MTKFSKEFFVNNRRCLRQLSPKSELIILSANGLLQRNSDVTFPFRQDSNFWYLTGIEEPDLILVIGNETEFIIIPQRDGQRTTFDGALDTDELTTASGIVQIYDEKQGWAQLTKLLKKYKAISTLQAAKTYEQNIGLYTNPARARLLKRIRAKFPGVKIQNVKDQLIDMRMVKQPAEIAAIQRAIDITSEAFIEVKKQLNDLAGEHDIEKRINVAFAENSVSHAYQPIVAGGERACTLHYIANNHPLNDNELVLIDAGAEFGNYASDITRTYAKTRPSKRQIEVFNSVVAVQEFAIRNLKLGITIKDYEKLVENFMGEKLRELGLIASDNRTEIRKYFSHATSHHLGLDTHDIAYYDKPIAPGWVLTVEPGIYIPEESIGIRIEDDVLITNNGVEVLSKSLSRDLV